MTRVYLGLGSNINAQNNIEHGVRRIAKDYTVLKQSPQYRSPAMGFNGPDFINLVLLIECKDELSDLINVLKNIEIEFGREADAVKFSSRHLDIDILMYGDLVGEFSGVQLPRSDIVACAYVLRPLLDIFPEGLHPHTQKPLIDLWPALASQPLEPL